MAHVYNILCLFDLLVEFREIFTVILRPKIYKSQKKPFN